MRPSDKPVLIDVGGPDVDRVPGIVQSLLRLFCVCVCLLLQYLIQNCARGGRRIVEDMCYEIRRAEACVLNAGFFFTHHPGRETVPKHKVSFEVSTTQ